MSIHSQVISTARTCNLILIVLDAVKPLTHKKIMEVCIGVDLWHSMIYTIVDICVFFEFFRKSSKGSAFDWINSPQILYSKEKSVVALISSMLYVNISYMNIWNIIYTNIYTASMYSFCRVQVPQSKMTPETAVVCYKREPFYWCYTPLLYILYILLLIFQAICKEYRINSADLTFRCDATPDMVY